MVLFALLYFQLLSRVVADQSKNKMEIFLWKPCFYVPVTNIRNLSTIKYIDISYYNIIITKKISSSDVVTQQRPQCEFCASGQLLTLATWPQLNGMLTFWEAFSYTIRFHMKLIAYCAILPNHKMQQAWGMMQNSVVLGCTAWGWGRPTFLNPISTSLHETWLDDSPYKILQNKYEKCCEKLWWCWRSDQIKFKSASKRSEKMRPARRQTTVDGGSI